MKKISKSDLFSTYCNHRAEPYFTFLKNGQKTIEGRLKKGEYTSLKVGDHILVYNEDETDSAEVVIKDLRNYHSIENMLENEKLNQLLPDIETMDKAISVYRKFYTSEQESEFGLIAIEVERI